MANVTYDILWREAMMELLDQLEAENPEDPMLAPRDLAEWSCIYIKYLQIFHKLETSYNQMVHPQKRLDMKRALEACCGRILEVRHYLVKLNRNLDFVNLDDILVDLKLTPDVLEVAIPRYFREDRVKELEDREKFLEALVEKYSVPRHKDADSIASSAALTREEEAIAVLQLNERGRQAREKARMMDSIKKQRQLEDKRSRSGIPLTAEDASIKIQKVARGYINRKRLADAVQEELEFLKMRPVAADAKKDPNSRVGQVMAQRKVVQRENQAEYDEAIVVLKQKVKEQEGQDMRETIQDKINAWFVENRQNPSGDYPPFPDKDDGGSRAILNPQPPEPPPLEGEDDKKAKGKGKGKEEKGKGKGKGGKGKGKGKEEAAEEGKEEVVSSIFVPDIEKSVQEYVVKWQDRDESTNFFQKYDSELVKDELRPIVFEEIRLQVDEEMRILLQNLVDMVDAERAAKLGKKPKKKKGKKKGKKGKGKGKGKKAKDPTADRSMESLYAELVSNGILQQCPKSHVQDYLGSFSFLGSILEKSNILPDPSMGQVRQAITEYCILPLGSQYIHEKVPSHIKSVLLYGMPRTGKTLLSHAVANLAGANFFNLSPRNTDGKYPGKAAALMIHMVFKVARTMAPSVIYIDEAEKVFVSDKKKKKEFQPYSEALDRIKKLLVKEWKKMVPGERVLVIGNSCMPQVCLKKDKKPFLSFWNKHIYVPVPDYASLRILWPGLFARHSGTLNYEFDLSTLCSISENYTSGDIDLVTSSMMTARRKEILRKRPLTVKEVLQWLSKVKPVLPDDDGVVRKWTNDLPVRAAILGGTGKRPKSAKKGKGKKGKK